MEDRHYFCRTETEPTKKLEMTENHRKSDFMTEKKDRKIKDFARSKCTNFVQFEWFHKNIRFLGLSHH